MSFQASIHSAEYQVLWTKVIYSLSSISDTVRLHLTKDRVTISSINSTKTSLFSVSFNSNKFFEDFRLHGDLSILVNSKPLALIFRNYRMGNEDVDFFRFTINESITLKRLNRSRNKLFIEIMARDNLKKTYSLNFVRCKESFDLKIDSKYKELLLAQNDDQSDKDRIHYLMIETSILKNFLDMFPPSIEDFKIEVLRLSRKLNLIGFNKQQLLTGSNKGSTSKESQALRQPMSLTVGLSLNDILGDNFPDDAEATQQERLNVVFRLKDFKTYVNLINSINFATTLPKQSNGSDMPMLHHNQAYFHHEQHLQNFVEILFNNPGFPLILSRRCELPNSYSTRQITNTLDNSNEEFELFKIELILISDSEGDNINILEKDLVIPNVQILQNDVVTTDDLVQDAHSVTGSKRPHDSLFVSNDLDDDDGEQRRLQSRLSVVTTNQLSNNRRKFNLKPLLKETHSRLTYSDIHGQQRETETEQSILWNDPATRKDLQAASNHIRNQTQEFVRLNRAMDRFSPMYSDTPDGVTQESQEEEAALGPTQGVYKVKGLFD